MIFRLHILNGPLRGQQITVGPEPLTVGRGSDCELEINDAEIALHHAVFEHRENGLFVRDLGAMGRVLVNRREQREAKLKHGDIVELAHLRLLVQAVVQSELPGPFQLKRQLQLARWVALLTVLCVVAVAALMIPRHSSRPPPAPVLPPVTNTVPVVMVVTSAPPTAELDKMREELEIVREAMRLLAARTSAPPVVVTVTAAPPVLVTPPPTVAIKPPVVVSLAPPLSGKTAAQPLFKIVSIEQQRLPAPSAFEDLRLLHIVIASATSNALPADGILLKTEFFDDDEVTGRVALTEALTPRAELHPEGWQGGASITLTASYAVPAGLRARQAQAGRKLRYAGYRVRVFAGGALQAEEIHPRWLLEGTP